MPSDAPAIKRERVAADGAQIVVVGTASDERQQVAEEIAAERGLEIIPPFDDDRIIAGQGTVGLELAEDLSDLAVVLVPVGGGGLASGVATAVRALRPSAASSASSRTCAADARESLERGEIVRWPAELVSRTAADGTRTQALGARTFAHLRAYLDAIVTVSEAEIAAAVRLGAERSRLVVEPSGALGIAAMAFHAREIGLDAAAGSIGRRRERRERRSRAVPRVPRGAGPARGLARGVYAGRCGRQPRLAGLGARYSRDECWTPDPGDPDRREARSTLRHAPIRASSGSLAQGLTVPGCMGGRQ